MAHRPPPPNPESQAILLRALAAGLVGTWYWDIASDAVVWDAMLCAVYGLTVETAPTTAQEFLDVVHHEDRNGTVTTISRALEGAAAVEHEFRASIGKREVRIHDRAHIIRDRDGRSTSMIGMCCDLAAAPIVPNDRGGGPQLRPIELAAYLGTVVESLRRDPQTTEIRSIAYAAEPAQVHLTWAVKLGLIVSELVAPVGASDRTASPIAVSLQPGKSSATLRITEANTDPLRGGPRSALAIGLESARALARQVGGALVASSAPNASWSVEFPLLRKAG